MTARLRHSRPIAVAVVCAAIVACKAPSDERTTTSDNLADTFESATLRIVADDGETHEFDVYVASEYAQQRRGLMFVRRMPEKTGMLFVYDDADKRSMWMKNTYISLDMVFARKDGTVSSVIHETQPLSRTPQSSIEPVTFVLELNAGVARKYNVGTRSRIEWDRD